MELRNILLVINVLVTIYLLLLTLRIILTWFRLPFYGQAWGYLSKITDPYLALFRGIRFLRSGVFDFTPLAAILTLHIVQTLLANVIGGEQFTLGFFLAIVVQSVWRGVAWILTFFAILSGVRLLGLFGSGNPTSPIWNTLDLMIQPMANQVRKVFRRELEYRYALLIAIGSIIAILILGRILIANLFAGLLYSLPI